jgi:hypothetical protein
MPGAKVPVDTARVAHPAVDCADQLRVEPPVFWILNESSAVVSPKASDTGVTLSLAGVGAGVELGTLRDVATEALPPFDVS